ncbi:MAG: hypothetical protein ACREK1_01165 [Longimicrobiales bacterium]
MSSERRSETRLPGDPAYWEDLAARSVEAAFRSSIASAGGTTVGHARGGATFDPWWRAMSDAAFVLAASAVLALFGGAMLLDERSPRAMTEAHAMTEGRALTGSLAPDDPLLASLLDAPAGPPPAATLLRLVALRAGER